MGVLHLSELTLSHVRSHRLTRLSLGPGPVAIHGPNGAGKTNILEAVSLLSPGRGLRRAATDDIARRPEALGWRITATVAADRARRVETRAEPGQGRTVRIDDKPVPQLALGDLLQVLWLVPAMDRLWIEAPEGRRRFLDRLALNFRPDHGRTVLSYERAMRERNRLLRDGVRDPHWYAALETQMAQAGATLRANRAATVARLAEAQDGAGTAFPRADLSIEDGGADDLAEALAAGRGADMQAGRTLSGPHRADLLARYADKGVAAAEASTGEQKALLISLVLAMARALVADRGAPPVLLLDEVAAHLDPDRRAALYDEVLALGVQAWMTGTEARLFDGLGGARGRRRADGAGRGDGRGVGDRMTVGGGDLALYALALLVLFLTPGPVWVALVARTLAGGFGAAWPLALGVAVGDVLWPLVAILGVSQVVAQTGLAIVFRWIAAGVFVAMGTLVILQSGREAPVARASALTRPGAWAGFAAGLAAILGNPKAVLFYMGMLPGFFDLSRLTRTDIAAIVGTSALVPVAGNLMLAAVVARTRAALTTSAARARMRRAAGATLIAVGLADPVDLVVRTPRRRRRPPAPCDSPTHARGPCFGPCRPLQARSRRRERSRTPARRAGSRLRGRSPPAACWRRARSIPARTGRPVRLRGNRPNLRDG